MPASTGFAIIAWCGVFLTQVAFAQEKEGDEPAGVTEPAPATAAWPTDFTEPWPAPVKDWQPVKANEHPRLIFRKADLPELRKRVETAEGKAIIDRCRKMLAARYTTWNAAGWAFLYQVTGQKEYAEKAKSALDKTLAAEPNPDNRYTFPGNGQLRQGPVLGAIGQAYDMAFDGWDEEYRRKIADFLTRNECLRQIAETPAHGPGCNHYGSHQGGAGMAVLAIRGDAGANDKLLDAYLEKLVTNVKREISIGHGPRGYYYEGHHCGRLSSNSGVIPFIQCYRNACGKDLVANCAHAQWLVPQWVNELTRGMDPAAAKDAKDAAAAAAAPQVPRNIQRGMYCADPFHSGHGLSSCGDFAMGFGICPKEQVPYVLWAYRTYVEPPDANQTYNIHEYPHFAAWALANWPLGVEPKCPDGVYPRVHVDPGPGYYVFRNGWAGGDKDIVVTALLGSTPRGGRGMAHGGSVVAMGLGGLRANFPGMFTASRMTYFKPEKDGSGVLSAMPLPGSGWKTLAANPPKRLEASGPIGSGGKADPFAGKKNVAGGPGPGDDDAALGDLGGLKPQKPKPAVALPKPGDKKSPAGEYGPAFDKVTSLAVDYSGRCGAPCLVAMVGPQAGYNVEYWMEVVPAKLADAKLPGGACSQTTLLQVGDETYYVMTVQKGKAPSPRVEKGKVVIGGRTIEFDGKKIVLGE